MKIFLGKLWRHCILRENFLEILYNTWTFKYFGKTVAKSKTKKRQKQNKLKTKINLWVFLWGSKNLYGKFILTQIREIMQLQPKTHVTDHVYCVPL